MVTKAKGNRRMIIWIAIAVLLIVIGILVTKQLTAKSYETQLREKQIQIDNLTNNIKQAEDSALLYKSQARDLSEQVLRSSKKIKMLMAQIGTDKKQMEDIKAPQNVIDTKERLEKLGLKAEVKCK